MPIFRVEETVPTWITWRCYIKANDEAQARSLFAEGERGEGEEGPLFGDAIDTLPVSLTVKEALTN